MDATVVLDELDSRDLDDAAVAALAGLRATYDREVLPEDPPVSVAEVADDCRRLPDFEVHRQWLAWAPGRDPRLIGAAVLELEYRGDNRHLAWCDVVVHPDARRRGLGQSLLARVAERAEADGRRTLVLDTVPGLPGDAFAERIGARTALVEHLNRLRTADVDRALLDRWIDRAGERAADYSLVGFDDRCPDDLLERFAGVLRVMNGAPRGELDLEDEVVTPAEVRATEQARAARGTGTWALCARHDPTGELVGVTVLTLPLHRPWLAWQGDTGVDPAHRGRGLGRWLKAVNLRRLLDERPAVAAVDTYNAGSNRAMLSINHALGFRCAVAWHERQVEVAGLRRRLAQPA